MKGTIRVYGCGGAGFNLISPFYGEEAKTEGFADLKCCFIDTSLSNIALNNKVKVKEEDVYILEGVDGSGKKRDTNYHSLADNAKHILRKFQPAEMNIVVSSASGGSGSVISNIIAKELLSANHPTIMIIVGSEESKITIENTVKTLQSIDTISRKHLDKPIVVSYFHNSKEHTRAKNDAAVRQTITALSILCSRQNAELDTADVANFIDFSKVTSVQSGITFLYLTSKEDEAAKIEYPISIASIFSEVGKTAPSLAPEYSCAGYVAAKVLEGGDLHFITSQHEVQSIYTRLNKRLEDFKESASARVSTQALNGNADDNGIVL